MSYARLNDLSVLIREKISIAESESEQEKNVNTEHFLRTLVCIENNDEEHYDRCRYFLKCGANINAKFSCTFYSSHMGEFHPNDTPVMYAVRCRNEKLLSFLLENNALAEVSNGLETPLMLAAYHHNEDIVKLLLKYGANPNTTGGGEFADLTTMHAAFIGLRKYSWNDYWNNRYNFFKQSSLSDPLHQEVVNLLEKAGFNRNQYSYKDIDRVMACINVFNLIKDAGFNQCNYNDIERRDIQRKAEEEKDHVILAPYPHVHPLSHPGNLYDECLHNLSKEIWNTYYNNEDTSEAIINNTKSRLV